MDNVKKNKTLWEKNFWTMLKIFFGKLGTHFFDFEHTLSPPVKNIVPGGEKTLSKRSNNIVQKVKKSGVKNVSPHGK